MKGNSLMTRSPRQETHIHNVTQSAYFQLEYTCSEV